MKRLLLAGIAVTLLSTGCATRPANIVAVPNAGPCTQADRAKLATLSKQQSDAATADTIGVILIGVPMASAIGGDKEAEIAILKGRCNG